MRLDLATPAGDLVQTETYNKLFTIHGIIMVWFFLIPSIPAVLGNFLVPLMVGARDLAFPRLNLLSWYVFITSGAFTLWAIVAGGVDTGWTFYTPYSTTYSNTWVMAVAVGVFINGFSSILTGLNFIVTIHTMRAPGLTWFRLPLFIWAIYATSLILVLATPVLAMTLALVALERVAGVGIFDPALGGDPLLFQHLFWFYSHPAVYIMILPGMGVVSEVIACFARCRPFGYAFIGFSSFAIAVFGFLVWGHHMFVSGQSLYAGLVFSALSFLVALPSGVKVFSWTATLYKAEITFETSMLYTLGFIGLFTIGGLTGLFVAAWQSIDTYTTPILSWAFPLHHGRRHGNGVPGRHSLLVAQDHGSDVSRSVGAHFGNSDLRRVQSDIFPPVHSRLFGHAATLSRISRRVGSTQRALVGRRIDFGGRISISHDLPDMVVPLRQACSSQPLACHGHGMVDELPATDRKFFGRARDDRRSLRLRAPGQGRPPSRAAARGGGVWLASVNAPWSRNNSTIWSSSTPPGNSACGCFW